LGVQALLLYLYRWSCNIYKIKKINKLGFEEACSKGQELLLIALSSRNPPLEIQSKSGRFQLSKWFQCLLTRTLSPPPIRLLKSVSLSTRTATNLHSNLHTSQTIVEMKGTQYRKCVNVFINAECSNIVAILRHIKYSTYTYSLSMFILCETKTVYYITRRRHPHYILLNV